MITHFLRNVNTRCQILKKTIAAKREKRHILTSVLGVAQTTPKLYCEKYGIILLKNQHTLLDFREDERGET